MNASLIVIDSDAELKRARALVDSLMASDDPADLARLEAQARLIEAYEQKRWPAGAPRTADIVRFLMDQHGLSRADMAPILGGASRVSEVLSGKKGLSMTMVQRLRARFGVPADVLLPPVRQKPRRSSRRKAA
jgi:HTH-type transcriptional regulator/antitoxin HigA